MLGWGVNAGLGRFSIAAGLLLISAPFWVLIAIGVKLSDPGPVFFVARRAGLNGVPFGMFKFRTMRARAGSRIAARNDSRVFRFGAFLRRTKLDEIPQLLNILRGEMAFVGPRPEDLSIVEEFYTAQDRETLKVLPGLISPGTLYYWAHVELDSANPEGAYVSGPLQKKLDLDRVYIANRTLRSDLGLIIKTAIICISKGSNSF